MFAAIGLVLWLLVMVGIATGLGFGVLMAVRAVRALERRSEGHQDVATLQRQMERLQAVVDQQSLDLERLRASQDFTTRLLEERSGGAGDGD